MVSPDSKPAALRGKDDVSDDLWLIPFQLFVRQRDELTRRNYWLYTRFGTRIALLWAFCGIGWIVVLPSRYQDWDHENIGPVIAGILMWFLVGVLIFASLVSVFRMINRQQAELEEQLVANLKPRYLRLGYRMDYNCVSKPFCASLFKHYTYSYLRIERLQSNARTILEGTESATNAKEYYDDGTSATELYQAMV
jgi:hypothetical protein